MNAASPPSAIDHLVLPVASLNVAEERLAALGFHVAPRGKHPFGTENACVYLADGTFLEPLAIDDAEAIATATRGGNAFTARDAAFRAHAAPEGMSALVFATDDARADHLRFVEAGVSAGGVLDFSRPFVDASGRSDEAAFRLAFAAANDEAGAFFFTCQRVHVPVVDRTSLTRHPNGVVALRGLVMASPRPEAVAKVVEAILDAPKPVLVEGGFSVGFAGGTELRIGPAADPHHRFTEIVFAVVSLDAAEEMLSGNSVAFERAGARISIPAASGQGVTFVFEEKR